MYLILIIIGYVCFVYTWLNISGRSEMFLEESD